MRKILLSFFIFCFTFSIDAEVIVKNINASDLVFSTLNSKLYAVVSSSDSLYGNSLVQINSLTGNVERNVYIGSNPKRIKLTSDNQYAYVSFNDIGYIKRINLKTFIVDKEIYLGPIDVYVLVYAKDFEVLPNDNNKIVVSRSLDNTGTSYDLALYIDGKLQPQKIATNFSDYYCVEQIISQSNGKKLLCSVSLSQGFGDSFTVNVTDTGLIFIKNYFNLLDDVYKIKSSNDTVYTRLGRIVKPFDSIPSAIAVCSDVNGVIEYAFTESQYNNSYIYSFHDNNNYDDTCYLKFYSKNNYSSYRTLKLKLPFTASYYDVIGIEAIDKNHVALIIYFSNLQKCIVIVDVNNITTFDKNISYDDNIDIFPNPIINNFYISKVDNIKRIEILSATGEILRIDNLIKSENKFDISSFVNGFYFIRIVTQEGIVKTKKIIKI